MTDREDTAQTTGAGGGSWTKRQVDRQTGPSGKMKQNRYLRRESRASESSIAAYAAPTFIEPLSMFFNGGDLVSQPSHATSIPVGGLRRDSLNPWHVQIPQDTEPTLGFRSYLVAKLLWFVLQNNLFLVSDPTTTTAEAAVALTEHDYVVASSR